MVTSKSFTRYELSSINSGKITLVPYPDFPNVAVPDLSKPDSSQMYDIGTEYEYNGKAYFYGYAKEAVAPNIGAKVYNSQDIAQVAIAVAAAQYATRIALTAGATDGLAHGGVFALDYLKGGHVVVFPAAGAAYFFTRGIIGSSVLAATGTIYLDLDAPIPEALTTSGYAEAMASPWKNVVQTTTYLNEQLAACCGVPTCQIPITKYGWFQTWGPCWISPAATLGAGANNRGAWLQGDGSLTDQDASLANLGQLGGWVMSNDKAGGQAAPFVYLMIAR